MNLHDLIFSYQRNHRITRHITFWLCWILFAAATQLTGLDIPTLSAKNKILFQLMRSLNRLLPQILFCYAIVYFLVPRFIPKRKYLKFFLSFFLMFAILIFVTYVWFYINKGLTDNLFNVHQFNPFITKFFSFYSNINFTGPLPATCLMLAIRYYKDWDKKQKEGETLVRENIQAELQLLKAQIHPHFLFNTLNNIYSFTLTGSPQAAGLIDKLSGMIDYITIDGEKPLVTLAKEIQLINDYIGLEKVRYGDRLDLQVEMNGNPENKLIAPLLMIPFVENCFKHGASIMRGQQWIHLTINIKEDQLDFMLSNSKPAKAVLTKNKKGIGLTNVSKRLELLYPGKHFLKTGSTDNTHTVHMKVTLQQQTEFDPVYRVTPKLQPV